MCRLTELRRATLLIAVARVAGTTARRGLSLRGGHGGSESGEDRKEHEDLVGELHDDYVVVG